MVRTAVSTCARPDLSGSVRNFLARRIVLLRHGGILTNRLRLWGLKIIAFALGVHEQTVVQVLRRWKENDFKLVPDRRKTGGVRVSKRKLKKSEVEILVSTQ